MKYVILLTILYGALSLPVEDEGLQEFINGNHLFTAAIYKEIAKAENGNFIVSPFSVEAVLALTNEGAKGDTSAELIAGLSLPKTKQKIQNVFKSLLLKLTKSEENLKLLSVNKIFVRDGLNLENDFNSTSTDVYHSGVSSVNFKTKKDEAVATINRWVEDNTDNKLKNLLNPKEIDSDTSIILVNALYFRGKWSSQFNTYETRKNKFFTRNDDSVEVDTMYQSEYLSYYENPTLNAKFLELPYQGDNISMVIVLPNEIEGLAKLEEKLDQVLLPQPYIKGIVKVELPRFTIETTIKFKPILENLGIRKLFTGEADLSGLSSTDKNLLVDTVVQKAFINVTEEGTEAAAATAVAAAPFSAPPRPMYSIIADHPFLYFIKHNEIVLFVGRLTSVGIF